MVSDRAFIFHILYIFLGGETLSLIPKSRSSVKVKYQGHSFQKMAVAGGIHVSQTHLVLTCFQKALLLGIFSFSQEVLCPLSLYHTIPTFTTMRKKPLENIVGKGENAGSQHFLLFPTMFSTHHQIIFHFFLNTFVVLSVNVLDLNKSEILTQSLGKELKNKLSL